MHFEIIFILFLQYESGKRKEADILLLRYPYRNFILITQTPSR